MFSFHEIKLILEDELAIFKIIIEKDVDSTHTLYVSSDKLR